MGPDADPQLSVPITLRRRQRLTKDELARRTLAAAREILYEQGVNVSLEDLGMDDVITRAGVPRSSVYRLWPYKGDFVRDLLLNLAGPDWMGRTAAFDLETLIAATSTVLARWEDLRGARHRRSLLEDVVRDAINSNFRALVLSREWYIFLALGATARGGTADENRQRLASAVHKAQQQFIDSLAGFYEAMGRALGLQLREGMTFRHAAAAGSALVGGLAVDCIMATANAARQDEGTADWSLLELSSGTMAHPIAGTPGWTLASIAYLGILDTVTEPIPRWGPTDEARTELLAIQDLLAAELRNEREASEDG